MKLPPKLASLARRCETICTPGCCGTGAYDFSPIQIASYLIISQGEVNPDQLEELKNELQTLRATYGIGGTSPEPVTFEEMNAIFGPEHMERFINKLEWNLEVALRLIAITEKERFRDEIGA